MATHTVNTAIKSVNFIQSKICTSSCNFDKLLAQGPGGEIGRHARMRF